MLNEVNAVLCGDSDTAGSVACFMFILFICNVIVCGYQVLISMCCFRLSKPLI